MTLLLLQEGIMVTNKIIRSIIINKNKNKSNTNYYLLLGLRTGHHPYLKTAVVCYLLCLAV